MIWCVFLCVLVFTSDVSTILSRPLLKEFAKAIAVLGHDDYIRVATEALEIIQPHAVGFEEQVHIIREKLASIYEEDGDYLEAAQVLRGIPIESSQRVLSDEERAQLYVHISMLYLAEDEPFEAEQFINKASLLIIKDKILQLKYDSCFAKILDAKRKFPEASWRYYQLSTLVPEHERLEVLEAGVVCGLLARAGPQRSRLLATFYKDERTRDLEIFPVLEKMFMERLLTTDDVKLFEGSLQDHQKASTGKVGDPTILERAVIENNIFSASKVYNNIRFEDLGFMLDISAEDAEKVAAKMITEDRLKGSIDQLERLIRFNENTTEFQLWDSHIASACNSVNDIIDYITESYPDFMATQ
eukprot:TRINITY_DN3557_c0_g1_i1.p1 TRINITY_DN3557_c0_g1~~TRINITY_DN3557_c0_g1_i1.p1  ORF type:complete len:358 (-),score=83.32 TRINITY_DN3557_c0_g1_i1:19-1092(-)